MRQTRHRFRRWVSVAVLSIFSILAQALPVAAAPAAAPAQVAVPVREVIVMYRDAATAASASATLASQGLERVRQAAGPLQLVRLPAKAVLADVMERLRADPNVTHVEPNYQLFAQAVPPNDPLAGEQWGLTAVSALEAWEQAAATLTAEGRTASPVTVAVLDTGVDATHPDLAGRVLAGHNVLDGSGTTTDVNGHGTAVAGVLAALTDNAEGIAGYAGPLPVSILPVKVLNDQGVGTVYDAALGIRWAADHGASVINVSFGAYLPDFPLVLAEAVDYAWNQGAVVVAAAGNLGEDTEQFFPAGIQGVVSVAALGRDLRPAVWSNLDTTVAAPGVELPVTKNGGGYTTASGTSVAAPVVAAGAAVIRSTYPDLTPAALRGALATSGQCYRWGGCPVFNMLEALQSAPDAWSYWMDLEEPSYNSSVSGAVTIRARIVQAAVVSRVVYTITATGSTTPVATHEDLVPPVSGLYTYTWDSTAVPDDQYRLVITAYNQSGQSVGSDSVTVRVQNQRTSGIAVQVLKPDGSPAAGAVVWVMHTEEHTYTEQRADANGRLILPAAEFPDGNDYVLFARGTEPNFFYYKTVRGPATVTLDATGATRVQLSGRSMAGEPLADAIITAGRLHPLANRPGLWTVEGDTLVGRLSADGTAEVWMTPGEYVLNLIAPAEQYVLETMRELSGQTATVAFHPQPGSLAAIRVEPDGAYTDVALMARTVSWSIPYGLRLLDPARPVWVSSGSFYGTITATRADPVSGEPFSIGLNPDRLQLTPGEERTLRFGGDLSATAAVSGETALQPGGSVLMTGTIRDAHGNALDVLTRAGATANTAAQSPLLRMALPQEGGSPAALEVFDAEARTFVPAWRQREWVWPQLTFSEAGGAVVSSSPCYSTGTLRCSGTVPGNLAPGEYTAAITLAAGPFGPAAAGGRVGSDPVPFTVVAATGQIQVLDMAGLPMAGAKVQVLRRGALAYDTVTTAVADANGLVRLSHRLNTTSRYMLAVTGPSALPDQTAEPEQAAVLIPLAAGAAEYPASVSLSGMALERVVLEAQTRVPGQVLAFDFSLLQRDADGYPLSLRLTAPGTQNRRELWVSRGTYQFRAGRINGNETYDLRTGWLQVTGPLPGDEPIILGGGDTAKVTIAPPADSHYEVEGIALFESGLGLAPMARGRYADGPVLYATPGSYLMQVVLVHNAPDGAWDYWLAREMSLLPGQDLVHPVDAAFAASLSLDRAEYAAGGRVQSTHGLFDGQGNRLVWLGNNLSQFPPEYLYTWVWYATGGMPVLLGAEGGELAAQNHTDRAPFLVIADQNGTEVLRHKQAGTNYFRAWCQGDLGCQDWLREHPSTFFGADVTLPQGLTGGLYTAVLEFHGSYAGPIFSDPVEFTGIGGLAPPHLNQPESPTRASQLTVSGSGLAGATVTIYRAYNGGGAQEAAQAVVAADGKFSATVALPDAGTYTLTAKAVYNGEESAISAAVTVVVDRTAPTAPQGLEWESPDHAHIRLRWTPVATTDLAGYRIWRDGEQVASVPASTLPNPTGKLEFLDSGLTGETDYAYSVEAVDLAGNVSQPATAQARTTRLTDTEPPAPPTNLRAEVAPGGRVTLSWDAATDNIGVVKYVVTRIPAGGPAESFEVTEGTGCSDTGLPASASFTYTVTAVDAAGNESEAAGPVAVQTLAMRILSFVWRGQLTSGGLIRPESTVNFALVGEQSRTASVTVAYREWVGGSLTDREAVVALAESATVPGTYHGSWTAAAGVAEFRSADAALWDGAAEVAVAGQSLPREVAGRLAVSVTHPAAATLAGSRVQVWSESRSAGGQATLGQTGAVVIPDLPPADDYTVRVISTKGQALASGSAGPVRGGLQAASTLTPLLPAGLQLRVVGAGGEALPNVSVVLSDVVTGQSVASLFTDAEGWTRWVSTLVENQQIRATVYGLLPYQTESSSLPPLRSGDNQAQVQLSRQPRSNVSGTVVRFDGQPMAGVRVTLTQRVGWQSANMQATTDASGRYSLEGYAGQGQLDVSGGRPPVALTNGRVGITVQAGASLVQDLVVTDLQSGQVWMDLKTMAFGSNTWTEWTEDGALANRLRFTVTDALGRERTAWGSWGVYSYPLWVTFRPGEALTACVDGERHGFGKQCVPVVLDEDRTGLANFALQDQRVQLTGTVADAGGEPLTSWTAKVTGPDGYAQTINSAGSERLFGLLPKPGTYQLTVSSRAFGSMWVVREVNVSADHMSGSLDLGQLQLTAKPTFGERAENRLLVPPEPQLPGAAVGLRASWRFTGADTATDAALLLEIPAASSFIAGSVTGDATLDQSRFSNGTYVLPLGNLARGDAGVARFRVKLADGLALGTTLSAAMRVRFTVNGVEREEMLDTAVIQTDGVTLTAPQQVKEATVFLTGRAPAGSVVQVRDGDAPLGETVAGETGYWQLKATLVDRGDPSRHLLRAVAYPPASPASATMQAAMVSGPSDSPEQTVLRSVSRSVLYDSAAATLLSIGLQRNSGKVYTFPVAQGPVAFPFTVAPGDRFTVTATFDNPGAVSNVRVFIGNTAADAVRDGDVYRATLQNLNSFGDIRVTFDPKPRSFADTPQPTAEEILAMLPPEWTVIEPEIVGEITVVDGVITLPKLLVHPDPAAPEKTLELSWTLEQLESFTPSGEDLARIEAGGSPVYDLQSALISDELGMVVSGITQTSDFSDLLGVEGPSFVKFNYVVNAAGYVGVAADWAEQDRRLDEFLAEVRANPNIPDKEPWESATQSIRSSGEIGILFKAVFLTGTIIVGATLSPGVAVGLFVIGMATDYALGAIFDGLFGFLEDKYDRACGCRRRGFSVKPFWIFDPSGYVYEAVPSNRLEGVQATAQYLENGTWVTWDSTWFEQVNPQLTDAEGKYGWDVPPGLWRVGYAKDGYAAALSEELVVPPPRTEVNVGLTSLAPPRVTGVTVRHPAGGDPDVVVEFSQYMRAGTLSTHTVSLYAEPAGDEEPQAVALSVEPVDGATVGDQTLSRSFRLVPAAPLAVGSAYRLALAQAVQNYAGTFLTDDYATRLVVPDDGQEPPVVTVSAPAVGALVDTGRPLIAAAVTAAAGVGQVELELDGTPVAVQWNADTGEATYTPATELAQGSHTAVLTATDLSGGRTTATWSFTVDSRPPQLGITVSPASVGPGSYVAVAVTSQEALAAAPSVRVSRPGGGTDLLLLSSDGYLRWTGSYWVPQVSATTTFTVTAEGRDLAGHTGTAATSLIAAVGGGGGGMAPADTVPPQLGSFSPADGSYVRTLRPVITVSVGDAAQATLHVNGTDVTGSAAFGGGSLTYTPAADLAQGLQTIAVTARDAAGNQAAHSWRFTVDTLPPILTIRLSPDRPEAAGRVEVTVESTEALTGTPAVTLGGSPVALTSAGQNRWVGQLTAPATAGEHTVQATATDLAGNRGEAGAALRVQIPVPTEEPADPDLPALTTGLSEGRLEGYGGEIVLVLPSGSVPVGTRVSARRLPAPAIAAGSMLRPFSHGFELLAGGATVGANLVQLILRFDPGLLEGIDARRLGIYRRDPGSPLGWTYVGGKVNVAAGTITTRLSGFSEYAVFAYTPTFADLLTHWSRADVEVLASRHLVNGTAPGRFEPDRSITRAEFAKLLVLMLAADPARRIGVQNAATPTFSDVAPGAWHYAYVETAYRLGLILGSGGKFRPDDPVTRQEMSVMMVRALGLEQEARAAAEAPLRFADAGQVADWARGHVAVAVQTGLLRGMTPEAFAPAGQATRAQAAVVVMRAMDRLGLVVEQ